MGNQKFSRSCVGSDSRHVLITGSGRGIGQVIALDLIRHGWRVAGHYGDSAEGAQAVLEEAEKQRLPSCVLRADLSCEEEVKQLIPETLKHFETLNVLILNASSWQHDCFETMTWHQTERQMRINVWANVLLIQDFLRLSLAPEKLIIMLLDQRLGCVPIKDTSYLLSKRALQTIGQIGATYPGVRSIGLALGRTEITDDPEKDSVYAQKTPLGRLVSIKDILSALHFILETPTLSSQTLYLNSGEPI